MNYCGGWSGVDGVVPVGVEVLAGDVHRGQLGVADLDPLLVLLGVKAGDHLEAAQRPSAPGPARSSSASCPPAPTSRGSVSRAAPAGETGRSGSTGPATSPWRCNGAPARACAQCLRKGSRVMIDAELDWREWTDQQNNRREVVTLRARQVLFEGARPGTNDDDQVGERDGSSSMTREPVAAIAPGDESAAPTTCRPEGTCRSVLLPNHDLGREARRHRLAGGRCFSLTVDPARAVGRSPEGGDEEGSRRTGGSAAAVVKGRPRRGARKPGCLRGVASGRGDRVCWAQPERPCTDGDRPRPQGNMWCTKDGADRIGRITDFGMVTEFTGGITSDPYGIAAGPDGNMWFAEMPTGSGESRCRRLSGHHGQSRSMNQRDVGQPTSRPVAAIRPAGRTSSHARAPS